MLNKNPLEQYPDHSNENRYGVFGDIPNCDYVPILIGSSVFFNQVIRDETTIYGIQHTDPNPLSPSTVSSDSTQSTVRSRTSRRQRKIRRAAHDYFDEAIEMFGIPDDDDSDFSVEEHVHIWCSSERPPDVNTCDDDSLGIDEFGFQTYRHPVSPIQEYPSDEVSLTESDFDVFDDTPFFSETATGDVIFPYVSDVQSIDSVFCVDEISLSESDVDYMLNNDDPEKEGVRDEYEKPHQYEPHSGIESKITINPDHLTGLSDEEIRIGVGNKLAHAEKIRQECEAITREEIHQAALNFQRKLEKLHSRTRNSDGRYEPQSGDDDGLGEWLEKLDALNHRLQDYSTVLRSREVDRVIKHVEGLVLLVLGMRETRSYTGIVVAVLGYLENLTDESIFSQLRSYITETIAMEAQSGDDSDGTPAWLEVFRSVTKNWKMATKLPGWKYFQRILSLAVSAGLCKAADINFTFGEMKLFTLKIDEKQASALDFLDAIFATADYFVEAGYEAFRTRSIRPFLFDNQTSRILDDAYTGIAGSIKAMPTGDLDQTKYKTEDELAHVIENTLMGYTILTQQTRDKNEKRLLQTRVMKLQEWRLEFIQYSVAGGLRESPYSIYLVGDPGIGKSMMTQVLVEVVLQANGINYTSKQIATVNPGDKFASTVRNDTLVVILDDFGNFVLEYETENPLKYIIEICNNVISYVPKADVNEKGKVVWRPKMVVTTSNMDNLLFNKLSNAPASAKRRGIRMKPYLKKKFSQYGRFCTRVYRELMGVEDIPSVPDVYEIDIQEWGNDKWEFFNFKGGKTEKLSYADALEFHISKSREHFSEQKDYVKNHGKIRERIVICSHDRVASTCLECKKLQDEEDYAAEPGFTVEAFEKACDSAMGYEPHVGVEAVGTFVWRVMYNRLIVWFAPRFVPFTRYVYEMTNEDLQRRIAYLHYMSMYSFFDWLPDCVVNSEFFEKFYRVYNTRTILMHYWQLLMCWFASFLLFAFNARVGWIFNVLLIWPYLVLCATAVQTRLMLEFRDRRGALPAAFTQTRDGFLKYALAGCFLLTGMALCYKMYNSGRSIMEPQGNIMPKTMKDIEDRDAEANPWGEAVAEELPVTNHSKCMPIEHLLHVVGKNLLYMSYEDDGKTKFADAFFTDSNIAIIPHHVLTVEPRKYTFFRRGAHISGSRFHEILSLKDVVAWNEDDMCTVQLCNSSPARDLRNYLPIELPDRLPFRMLWKSRDGEIFTYRGVAKLGNVNNGVRKFLGYTYDLDSETFRGMCGAVMVSDTKHPQIFGFHIGGLSGTPHGCAIALTAQKVQKYSAQYFDQHVSALRHINEGTVYEAHYGISWFESSDVHPKSGLNFLPADSNIRYFGSCIGRAKYYSEVVPTPICDKVTEECDYTQEYAGPHFNGAKNWFESLEHLAQPAIGCETALLDWAVTDYSNQLDEILEVEGITEGVKPLTEIEIVSGQDGKRFVDAMKPNTAPGYPLTGPKRNHMIDLEPNDEHNCPRTFKPSIWEEVRRAKNDWQQRRRIYAMFKACLKDEPTKIEKTKVRVFEAAPLVLQIVIREYFLPLARLLSLFPLISECAVGINAMGPEWHALQEEIKKYGIERIVAGDYAKYDLRMSAKLTSAAFKVLIIFAQKLGYTNAELEMMEAVATEVVYPMVAYNGDVVMFQGSNPSGQNLTVYINSIVNSLLNRIGFRIIYPKYTGTFKQAIALITYGDDFKSSANKEFPEFHHITLADALATIDMRITMPDKEAVPVPFLHDENCDFLKRHNRLHEVGYYLGALDENSILKSLKAVLKSKHVTVHEQSAQNIDGALREWFLHGREKYEERREQMKRVADSEDISHMCQMLDKTFDDCLEVWKKKYDPNALVADFDFYFVDEEEIIYEPHAGEECVERVVIDIENMMQIEHICKNGQLYYWFSQLPGPMPPVDYLNMWLWWYQYLIMPIGIGIIIFMIAHMIYELRVVVRLQRKRHAAQKAADREMIGMYYQVLRKNPHYVPIRR